MGAGPLGSIRAQSFEIRDSGDRVVFSGNVIARLYPDRPETPVSPDGFPGATLTPAPRDPANAGVTDQAAPGRAPPPSEPNETSPPS